MTPERWQEVGNLFHQALDRDAGERLAWLSEACKGDSEVHQEVLSLLANHDAAQGGFVQERVKQAVVSFYESSPGPARVGPYRLVSELGRGGMGTVYLAQRDDDQYENQVAIKLVRQGMDTDFILARFRRERQTLAWLQHPNIARLLDGGTTEGGLPYIVMEYIGGDRITNYAREQKLDIDERVRLFLPVCHAVDYAHRNFIVHRDIKPGNILVDEGGTPKLLDFGICKLLYANPMATEDTSAGMLTPEYASPEQVRGDAVTVVSDVYSLGAVLYELLTGARPHLIVKNTPRAIEEAICEQDVVMPSAACSDRMTARRLSGDLDNILRHALEKEPERRYESAAELAGDLERYLANEPIRARRQTLAYQGVKFVRRNRGAVAAVGAVMIALVAGAAVSLREATVARRHLNQVRGLANKFVFDVHDAVRDLPGSMRARELIAKTGLEYLDAIAPDARGNVQFEKELAAAYHRLGDVQADVTRSNLGNARGALASYQKALGLLDDVVRRRPAEGADPALMAELADLHIRMADMRRGTGDYAAALNDSNQALELSRRVESAKGRSAVTLQLLANANASIGTSEAGLGKLDGALKHFREGASEMEQAVALEPKTIAYRRQLMLALGHVADASDVAGARAGYTRIVDIAREIYRSEPADQRAIEDYGTALSRQATVMPEQDREAKLAVLRDSLKVLRTGASADLENNVLRTDIASVSSDLGDTLRPVDRNAAQQAWSECAELADPISKLGQRAGLVLLIGCNRKLAENYGDAGQRGPALDYARRALAAAEDAARSAPIPTELPRAYTAMGLAFASLSRSRARQADDREQARHWLEKAMDAWRTAQSDPGFGAPHRREMRETELALAGLGAL